MADKIKIDPEAYLNPGEFARIAAERFTRTPIRFTHLKENTGEYGSYPRQLDFLNKVAQIFPKAGIGVINVDPNYAEREGGIPLTIQHEATHAAANNLPGIDEISSQSARYDYLKSQLQNQIGAGSSPKEVLAYANSNDPAVNKDWMSEYISDITQKLRNAGLGGSADTLSRIHAEGGN